MIRKLGVGLIVAAALLAPAGAADAGGLVFTVTKTADTNDGLCDADCSLREAILAANASPGADTVSVPPGTYTLTITGVGEDAGATGDLDVTDDLSLIGGGADETLIQGCDSSGGPCTGIDRVFYVAAGTVFISGVTIRNGGNFGSGGGIQNGGTLTITDSTITSNRAGGDGGGVHNFGTMSVINSTIDDNISERLGGGISNNNGILTITGTTLHGNHAAGGGGLANSAISATLVNSTISGNTANGGGGISNSGLLTIVNSTLSGNSTLNGKTGGALENHSSAWLKSTILKNGPPGSNCVGAVTSEGYNLSSDASCTFAGPGDKSSVDPLLGPIAENGGPTQTHALLTASPAIDAGSPDCPLPVTDQRGMPRPSGPACDIGAFELHDDDADGVDSAIDNCPSISNAGQTDSDQDGAGDVCDDDDDGDGVMDEDDLCSLVAFEDPADTDGDLKPDACDGPGSGNVDCSGPSAGVNSVDALKVLRHSAGLSVQQNEPCTDIGDGPLVKGWVQGDVNCSGGVNSVDALLILRANAVLGVALPPGCPAVKPEQV